MYLIKYLAVKLLSGDLCNYNIHVRNVVTRKYIDPDPENYQKHLPPDFQFVQFTAAMNVIGGAG